jgi:hypothetical protein
MPRRVRGLLSFAGGTPDPAVALALAGPHMWYANTMIECPNR